MLGHYRSNPICPGRVYEDERDGFFIDNVEDSERDNVDDSEDFDSE